MISIVLAGGDAQRLGSLTSNTPKPLLPVGGKPIIQHTLEKLTELPEVERTILSTDLKFEPQFRQWLAEHAYASIETVPDPSQSEEDKLGSVAALALLTTQLHDDCLVVAGDNQPLRVPKGGHTEEQHRRGTPKSRILLDVICPPCFIRFRRLLWHSISCDGLKEDIS